jgi:hypothetical protein
MERDKFYADIVQGLETLKNGNEFEACVTDLLKAVYPSLAPVKGGKDSGVDGTIGLPGDHPIILLATTGADALGNLTSNLESYLKDAGTSRQAVFVTSHQLTAPKAKQLYDRANELGFNLVNVHQQDDIAKLLYRRSEWCTSLLGLTGAPPALSKIPLRSRLTLDIGLIGQKESQEWLSKLGTDGLLVGQPGTGKTYLLQKFAEGANAWFITSDDFTKIAAGLREFRPDFIIVDDAHVDLKLVQGLIHFREDTKSAFKIIASSWPGSKSELEAILTLGNEQTHCLDLLSRDEIVEIVRLAGIRGPNSLIREIVDQSEGKPALAVAIVQSLKKDGPKGLITARELVQSSFSFLESKLESKAKFVVAAFSIGGKEGMKLDIVAPYLSISQLEVREIAAALASGGILHEINKDRLSVRPPALREALIRDVFYRGPMSLNPDQLIENSPNPEATLLELIGSKSRGAEINTSFLQTNVETMDSPKAWQHYAGVGEPEAQWVLDDHPEKVEYCAGELLFYIPDKIIPILMELAITDTRSLNNHPEHPLRLIEDWVKAGNPMTGQDIRRRDVLITSAIEWLQQGRDNRLGAIALSEAFSIDFENNSFDPGKGLTVTFATGYISPKAIESITNKWDQVKALFCSLVPENWIPISKMLSKWALLLPGRAHLQEPSRSKVLKMGMQMISDVEPCIGDHPGLQLRINELREHVGLQIITKTDPEFVALFGTPPRRFEREEYTKWQSKNRERVSAIATRLASLPIETALERVSRFGNEAFLAGNSATFSTSLLYSDLVKKTDQPKVWFEGALKLKRKDQLLIILLMKRIAKEEPLYLDQWSIENFSNPDYQNAIASIAIHNEQASKRLLDEVLVLAGKTPNLIDRIGFEAIPIETAKLLLTHQNEKVATNAAINEWYQGDEKGPRPQLRLEWEQAIVNSKSDDYAIKQILERDKDLALRWLRKTISGSAESKLWEVEEVMGAAVVGLDRLQRKELLHAIELDNSSDELINWLVDMDPELYRELLSIEKLKVYATTPFARGNSPEWIQLARLALDSGIESKKIAGELIILPRSWMGPESNMWEEEKNRVKSLLDDEDARIREIGKVASAYFEQRKQEALLREKRESVFGFDRE